MTMHIKMQECWMKQVKASIEIAEREIRIQKDLLEDAEQIINDNEEMLTLYKAELTRLEAEGN